MKQVCIFLSGALFGMAVTMFIFLAMLDNRMDNLQPPLEGMTAQMYYLLEDVKSARRAVMDCGADAIITNDILRDCIDIGREEANMYNRVIMKIEGDR